MTFTQDQITAAFLRWEQALRAKPEAFQTHEQVSQLSAEEAAQAATAALVRYMQQGEVPT